MPPISSGLQNNIIINDMFLEKNPRSKKIIGLSSAINNTIIYRQIKYRSKIIIYDYVYDYSNKHKSKINKIN